MAEFLVSNSNGRFTLKLTLTEGAYNVADNTSPVTYKLDLIANTSYNFTQHGIGRKIVLGGNTVYEGARVTGEFSIAKYGTLTLASGSATIAHDADGNKNLPVEYSIDMASAEYTAGSLHGTGTMQLAQIPRQATLTVAPDFTDEQNPTITYSNPAGNAVGSLMACISLDGSMDDIAYRDVAKTGSSYTFALTEAERNVLRNATKTSNTRSVYFYLRTIISGTTYHSVKKRTLSIVNGNPTFTDDKVSYADVNEGVILTTGNNQHIVQNQSSLTATFGAATGNKGATITEYILELNGVTKTATASGSVSFGAVNSSQDVTLYVTAKDSRGNTTTAKRTVTVLAWSPPVVNVTIERLNNYEDETYLKVNASISAVNGKNEIVIEYSRKQAGGDEEWGGEISNDTQYTIVCDKNYEYEFLVVVHDLFSYTEKVVTLPKGKFPFFIDTEKNAVGINAFPSADEALRVAGGRAVFENRINNLFMGSIEFNTNTTVSIPITGRGVSLVCLKPNVTGFGVYAVAINDKDSIASAQLIAGTFDGASFAVTSSGELAITCATNWTYGWYIVNAYF